MTYVKLNQNYYLSNEDVGSLVCVKVLNNYYNEFKEYQNSIILKFEYDKNKKSKHDIRPTIMSILTEVGDKKLIRLEYSRTEVHVKFLSRPESILLNE